MNGAAKYILLLSLIIITGYSCLQAQIPRISLAPCYVELNTQMSFPVPQKPFLVDSAFNFLQKKFKEYGCLQILSKDTLRGKIYFDQMGYPSSSSLKRAARAKTGLPLIKITVKILETGSSAVLENGSNNYIDLQKMKVDLKIFIIVVISDANGKEVFQSRGEAFTQGKVYVNGENMFEVETVRQEWLHNPIYNLMADAISQICDKIQ